MKNRKIHKSIHKHMTNGILHEIGITSKLSKINRFRSNIAHDIQYNFTAKIKDRPNNSDIVVDLDLNLWTATFIHGTSTFNCLGAEWNAGIEEDYSALQLLKFKATHSDYKFKHMMTMHHKCPSDIVLSICNEYIKHLEYDKLCAIVQHPKMCLNSLYRLKNKLSNSGLPTRMVESTSELSQLWPSYGHANTIQPCYLSNITIVQLLIEHWMEIRNNQARVRIEAV